MSNTNKPTNTGESAVKTPVANPTLARTEEMDIELTTDGNPNPPGQAVPLVMNSTSSNNLVESIPTLDESTITSRKEDSEFEEELATLRAEPPHEQSSNTPINTKKTTGPEAVTTPTGKSCSHAIVVYSDGVRIK